MHSDFTKAPIRIDLVGVDVRARERFEAMFRDLGQNAHLVVNSTVAEVAIVDLDHPDGEVLWHRYCQRFPNRPVILLSGIQPPPERGEKYLRKPIHVGALLEVLDEIRPRLAILGANGDSQSSRELTDDAEPGTIKITDRSKLVPPDYASSRSESSRISVDAPQHAKPNREPSTSCCTNLTDVGDRTQDGPADAAGSMSSDHSSPATPQPARATQTLAEEFAEFDDTSEKTYRYPQSPRHSRQADDSWSQPQGASATNAASTLGDRSEPVDGLELSDSTQRIRVGDTMPPPVTFLPVHERLLGLLQTALRESDSTQCAVELCLENGRLVVYSSLGRIQSSFTDRQLKYLAKHTFPATQVHIGPCRSDSLAPSGASRKQPAASETVEAFLWKLALWTYRGCLPFGTHLEQRVYLRHWPNLTRLRPVPDAMRIASLWCEQPMTLGYTAKALEIPQQHVFDFYCASHAIGLAGQARREADYLFQEASAQPKGKRRLVSDMMKRLRFIGNG